MDGYGPVGHDRDEIILRVRGKGRILAPGCSDIRSRGAPPFAPRIRRFALHSRTYPKRCRRSLALVSCDVEIRNSPLQPAISRRIGNM